MPALPAGGVHCLGQRQGGCIVSCCKPFPLARSCNLLLSFYDEAGPRLERATAWPLGRTEFLVKTAEEADDFTRKPCN